MIIFNYNLIKSVAGQAGRAYSGVKDHGVSTLTFAYLLMALFFGWLAAVLYRIGRHYLIAGGSGEGIKRLAVLMTDEGDRAEWIVRSKVAAAIKQSPRMKVVLVDWDSADQTPLILERIARQFNLGFCRLSNLGGQCVRSEKQSRNAFDSALDLHDCPAPCFTAAGLETGTDVATGFARTNRCVVCTGKDSLFFQHAL